MASIIPRALRPATSASRRLALRCPFSVTATPRQASVGNVPPSVVAEQQRREMGIGELEESEFKIQPLRRVGEDEETMRARLIYQSRKRGILESDLLLSTFADERLPHMSKEEMTSYDLFLDENDWDIYYWATQEAPSSGEASAATSDTSSAAYVGGAEAEAASKSASSSTSTATSSSTESSNGTADFPRGTSPVSPLGSQGSAEAGAAASAAASAEPYIKPGAGEWAQTVGTFKPAYRPVPARWKDSAILRELREHVKRRATTGKGGMAFMPPLRS